MTALTTAQSVRLADLEAQIEAARDEYAEKATETLIVIRDERLYLSTHNRFEDYCQERWGLTRRHVNRMIQHVEVDAILGPIGPKINEGQARELAPLLDQPDRLRETWQQVNEQTGGKPTAAAIRGIVRPEPVQAPEPEVMSPEAWAVTPVEDAVLRQTAHLEADLDRHLSNTDDRFLLNLARALAACNSLLALSPQRAAETCVNGSDDHAALMGFLDRIESWIGDVRRANAPSLRSVK